MRAKRFGLLWMCCLLMLLLLSPAYAASSDVIQKVRLRVNVKISDGDSTFSLSSGYFGDDANVTVSSDAKYDIEEVAWTREPANDEWDLGDTPRFKVTLYAVGDAYFSGSYGSSSVSVEGATFISASRKDRDTLVVTLGLKTVGGQLEEPNDTYWSETTRGLARWEKVEHAASYELRLYKGSSLIKTISNISGRSVECYPYMTAAGTYSFRVRAIASDSATNIKDSPWAESDELEIKSNQVYTGTAPNEVTNSGSQVGWIPSYNEWYFKYPDGTLAKNVTLQIKDSYYRFDGEGKMVTGWQNIDNHTYYFHEDGRMQHGGWLKLNDKWYLFNQDGTMVTGWYRYKDNWYFMGGDGAAYEGWNQVSGNWYYFTVGDGRMVTNSYVDGVFWVNDEGIWVK